jgi:serine/threonine-protein kinase
MIEFRTLGALDLKASDGRDLGSILAQPKRLSLLAYLAIRDGREFARRDTLLALFWPEFDDDHARGALRQALRFLRRSLGDTVVIRRGEGEIGLCHDEFWCDAVAFERACDAGEVVEADRLYRGDLLEGFHVSEVAPEFDLWLEAERQRLRRRAAQVEWALAERYSAAGEGRPATECARRAVSLSPDDEGGQRRLIALLDRSGDRAGAVRVYQELSQRLAAEFGVEPAAETRRLISGVRARHQPEPPTASFPSTIPVQPAAPDLAPTSLSEPLPHQRPLRWRAARIAGLVAILIATALVSVAWWPRASAELDPSLVAVFPFRVSGADPALAYLREGMVDLLAVRLTGEGGARAMDPRTALAAWRGAGRTPEQDLPRGAALRAAGRMGAGRVLLGEVVGSESGLVLTASLYSAGKWWASARASAQGPIDSLTRLVDQLAARLLILQTGEPYQRMAAATTTQLPALRSYLEGRQAYRRGRYPAAMAQFQRAVGLDPAFALAGMGLATAATWTHEADVRSRGLDLAWSHREHLSSRDRALLTAYVGPRYPRQSSWAEVLAAWELASAVAPDQPEAWYELGDALFHAGPQIAVQDAHRRAAQAFRRAVELDSSYAGPLGHLVELSALAGDTAGLRHYGALYLAADSASVAADFVRWRIAVGLGDGETLRGLRQRFGRMDSESLRRILGTMQLDAIGWEDVDGVAAALQRDPGESVARAEATSLLRDLAMNRGRPRAAMALAAYGEPNDEADSWRRRRIDDAIFGDGDTAAAAAAVRELGPSADGPSARDPAKREAQSVDICVVNLWRMTHRQPRGVARAIAALRAAGSPPIPSAAAARSMLCAALLDAMIASAEGRGDAGLALNRVDSLELAVPHQLGGSFVSRNLLIARLHEARGDRAGALATVRRRVYSWLETPYLSSFFREEGRLASLTGDRAGAIRAYQHYLTLRSDPEPELGSQVAQVRAALDKLRRGSPP